MRLYYIISLIYFLFTACETIPKGPSEELVRKNFEEKFYTYSYISSSIESTDNDTVIVSVKFKKPNDDQTNIVNQQYYYNSESWTIISNGEKKIINPLPALIDETVRLATIEIKKRKIIVDTVQYKYDRLLTPHPPITKVVIDIIYKGQSIAEKETYIPEGGKITLVLNE